MRSGPDFPCQVQQFDDGRNSKIHCQQCKFVFPNQQCYDHHLANEPPPNVLGPQDGRSNRPFRSICQMRRVCGNCSLIVYDGQTHHCMRQCTQQQQQEQGILLNPQQQQQIPQCRFCSGPHLQEQPCFIQPLSDSMSDVETGQQSRRRNNNNRPIRICCFDIETLQDEQFAPTPNCQYDAYKHVALLIVAEVICEFCIRDGITIQEQPVRRANDCVCGRPVGDRGRRWCRPPFRNAPGDNTQPPQMASNPRRMFFHSFDDATLNPVDEFLDYLMHTGPKDILTICIAHNGGKFDFHLCLEGLHKRSVAPQKITTTGLKIYSIQLGGQHQRRIVFKDSLNYFFCKFNFSHKSEFEFRSAG